VEQRNQQYAYFAVDVRTEQVLLRDWRLDALVALCRRLGWTLEATPSVEGGDLQQAG